MKTKYINIFYILFLSISLSISMDTLLFGVDNKVVNIDLGLEKSQEESIPSSFWDIESPFFYSYNSFNLDTLNNIKIFLDLYNKNLQFHNPSNQTMEYLETRDYFIRLIKTYRSYFSNSKKNLFISLGFTPSPILTFWEGIHIFMEQNPNIPINPDIKRLMDNSEFINIPFSKILIYDKDFIYPLESSKYINSSDIYKNFFKVFDRYIDPSILKDKNIIILDFTLTEISFFNFTRLFLRYLDYKSIPTRPHLHLIRTLPPNPFVQQLSLFNRVHVSNISKRYPHLSFILLSSFFKEYSKHSKSTDKTYEKIAFEEFILYKDMVKKFMSYIKNDPKLITPCFHLFIK